MHDKTELFARVSVIITSYNYARYIGQAIESVLSQDYPNIELIVLDNCSTDNSVDVIQGYAADKRLRIVVNEQNIGLMPNHNKGIGLATGAYLVFLSADDAFLPGHLGRAIEYYRTHPDIDVLYTPYFTMDDEGRLFERFLQVGIPDVEEFDRRNELVDLFLSDNYMCLPTMLFPREILESFGPFDLDVPVAADFDLFLRCITSGVRFGFLNVASIAMRRHAENRSGNSYISSGAQLREHAMLLDRYVVPKNYWRLHGREAETLVMLRTKMGNLNAFPRKYAEVVAELQPALDAVVARLQGLAGSLQREQCPYPRVSIIVPTYGQTALLENCLASLAAQSFTDFEAVIVHDGGADIEPFVRRFGNRDRFRYVRRRAQQGPADARNIGLKLALGDIIMYLDDDNVFDSTHVERMVRALDQSGLRVVYCGARVALEDVNFIASGARNVVAVDDTIYGGPAAWPVRLANPIPLNCIAHFRSCLEAAGTFSAIPILEDLDFIMRLGSVFPAQFVDACSVEIRVRGAFAGQYLGARWPQYLDVLRAIHERHAPGTSDATLSARQAYAARLGSASPTRENTVIGMLGFIRLLAGAGSAG